jgi:hypothetical protein
MALQRRFNPPPNWPAPPAGWSPPPGWQPDPSWGPPPAGWPVWQLERANPRAWLYALAAAGALYAVLLVVVLIATGGRLNARTAGEFFAVFLIAGVITGIIGWTRPRRWPAWLYPLLVLAFFAALRLLAVIGQVRGR